MEEKNMRIVVEHFCRPISFVCVLVGCQDEYVGIVHK